MASLHTLNSAEYSRWQTCRTTLVTDDLLLLIEEGVYQFKIIQAELPAGVQLRCLQSDLISRGLLISYPPSQTLDYPDWVKLCCQYQRNVSW